MRIEASEIHLGRQDATEYVLFLASELGIDVPSPSRFSHDILLTPSVKTFRINFAEEIEHTQNYGKARMLQAWYDAEDKFLQPAIEMAAFSTPPGMTVKLEMQIGSHRVELSNNGIVEPPEISLAKDIEYYHRSTLVSFNNEDISGTTRSFRGFLHSCVSLVDCFLFRYSFILKEESQNGNTTEETRKLDSRAPVDERLDAWMQVFAPKDATFFRTWNERSHFIELKNKRNGFTHPTTPSVKYEPSEIVKFLNMGSSGVGKLLARMRRTSGSSDKIGFISQVATIPKARIIKDK